jgi:hypothetical protein
VDLDSTPHYANLKKKHKQEKKKTNIQQKQNIKRENIYHLHNNCSVGGITPTMMR